VDAECSHRYAGGVLKGWRGGRDDLALPSRRARARVSAAGDASLRPWPREQHACMRASGSPPVAPSESTDSADVLGLRMLAPAEGLPGRRVDRRTRSLRRRTKIPRYARILIIFFSCGGMSCSCQWYRVCDAGALRAEPLATLMSCAVTIDGGDERSPKGNLQRRGPNTQYHVRIAPHRKPCQQFTYGYVRKSYIH